MELGGASTSGEGSSFVLTLPEQSFVCMRTVTYRIMARVADLFADLKFRCHSWGHQARKHTRIWERTGWSDNKIGRLWLFPLVRPQNQYFGNTWLDCT